MTIFLIAIAVILVIVFLANPYSFREREVLRAILLAILTICVIGFLFLLWTGTVSATPNRDKVSICHATSSESNPYVSLNVAQDSVDGDGGNDNGQGDHYLNHPNDIIPPISDIHSGLNWTTEGQAIWNNGCKPHHPTTTSTSTSTSTTTTTTSTTIPTSSTSSTTSSTTTVPRTTSTTTTVKPNTSTTSTTSTTVAPIVETYVAPAAPISFTG